MAEVAQLRAELNKERQEREKLQKWMQTELEALRKENAATAAKNSQITGWIKDNLGPNLEHVKKLIEEMAGNNGGRSSQTDSFQSLLNSGPRGTYNLFHITLMQIFISL